MYVVYGLPDGATWWWGRYMVGSGEILSCGEGAAVVTETSAHTTQLRDPPDLHTAAIIRLPSVNRELFYFLVYSIHIIKENTK